MSASLSSRLTLITFLTRPGPGSQHERPRHALPPRMAVSDDQGPKPRLDPSAQGWNSLSRRHKDARSTSRTVHTSRIHRAAPFGARSLWRRPAVSVWLSCERIVEKLGLQGRVVCCLWPSDLFNDSSLVALGMSITRDMH